MAACRVKLRGIDPTDIVQDTLLRTHRRILSFPAAKPVGDPTGLAMKILHDLQVDYLRRKEMLQSGDAGAQIATEEREVALLPKGLLPWLFQFFPGEIQRAILRGLVQGETTAAVAVGLDIELKEVNRVADEMAKRLWSSS